MHSLRRVIIVKRVYEMKKMYCVFNYIFRLAMYLYSYYAYYAKKYTYILLSKKLML